MQSQAIIQTASAKRYLGQFCKHFAHKAPVELDPALASGQVQFGAGLCRLSANEDTLTMDIGAETQQNIATLQDVVARHLVRFAFREDLTLNWQQPLSQ
jgi:hypothetical protein